MQSKFCVKISIDDNFFIFTRCFPGGTLYILSCWVNLLTNIFLGDTNILLEKYNTALAKQIIFPNF